jgi:hypothetical protein
VKHDKKLVRFYFSLVPKDPEDPVWSVIRILSEKIGEELTTHYSSTPSWTVCDRTGNLVGKALA